MVVCRRTMAREHKKNDDEDRAETLADMIVGDNDKNWLGEIGEE